MRTLYYTKSIGEKMEIRNTIRMLLIINPNFLIPENGLVDLYELFRPCLGVYNKHNPH